MRNKAVRTNVKNVVKNVRLVVGDNDNNVENAQQNLNSAKSSIDKAAKKGVIHKRTAARKISRLTKMVNGLNT
jgi:small subunit ribosomal protein S20